VIRQLSVLLILSLIVGAGAIAGNSNRIYGKISTVDGDEFRGYIRWDKNEASWVDMLDGSKEISRKNMRKARRGSRNRGRSSHSSVKIFGLEFGSSSSYSSWGNAAQSGIRFGHIKTMEVVDDDRVLLTLKSGEEVELFNGSTDIGNEIREIIIEDEDEGEIELVWDDLETIEFEEAPDLSSSLGDRLYGTLSTRRGDEFTGYVCWDYDEVCEKDILDGDDKRRRKKIKFGRIAAIERYSSSGSTVILKDGEEMVLRGTNDVNDDNSGIIICDPGFGQVEIEWDEFERLEFSSPRDETKYDSFDGGHPLDGTVLTEDGETFTGRIRWDNDEEFSWEILDGNYHNLEFDIEFGLIKSIEKRSYRSAIVTVWDGRSFRLRGSNDVDEDNKGIYIISGNGDEERVDWEDFASIEFKK